MPNWCNNRVIFERPVNISEFIAREHGNYYLNAQKLIPLTEDEADNISVASEKWGTKWEPECLFADCNPDLDITDFSMDTAWSPPTPLIVELCKRLNVSAELWYYETGCMFAGIASIHADGTIEDDYTEEPKSELWIKVADWFDPDREDYENEEEQLTTKLEDK